MNKLKYTTALQSGRSMVEMLGVLAVIGVLSIGGIMGYSYAMDKYRANTTLNDINLRGVDLVRQVATNQSPDLSDWPSVSQVGYAISEANLSGDGEAYFSISGIPQRVCKMIYEGIQNNQTTIVEINESTNGNATDCQSENNTMTFFFITTTSENVIDLEKLCDNMTCPQGYSCTHGICMSEEKPQLYSGTNVGCKTDTQCSECKYCENYTCYPKPNGTTCTGGICQDGNCVFNNNTCTSHNDCTLGYFCDSDGSNLCVKVEFYNTSIPNIYISKHANSLTDLCERSGFYAPSKEQLMKIGPNFNSDVASSASIYTTDYGFCDYHGYCVYKKGFSLCTDDINNFEP